MVNGPRDIYIGQVNAGNKNRSLALTTTYQIVMPENAARVGFVFESDPDNTVNIWVRFNGIVYELVPGGSLSRSKATGSVWVGVIEARTASSTANLIAEEN